MVLKYFLFSLLSFWWHLTHCWLGKCLNSLLRPRRDRDAESSTSSCSAGHLTLTRDSGPASSELCLTPSCVLTLHSKGGLKHPRARTGTSGLGSDFGQRWIPSTSCVTRMNFPSQHQLHSSEGVSDETIPCPVACRLKHC